MKINTKYDILTPDGFEHFDGINIVKKASVELEFHNRSKLRASFNHKIYKSNDEEILMKDVTVGMEIKGQSFNFTVTKIKKHYNKTKLYDVINSGKNHLYISNGIVSHNCAFLGSGDNVIDGNVLRKQEIENVIPPIAKDAEWEHNVWIWKAPEPGHRYIASCLPEGEIVLTDKGSMKIEDVTLDNKLYNINGDLVDIINTQTKHVDEEIVKIKLSNIERSTKFTKNHPIWVSQQPELKRNYKLNHEIHEFNDRYWDFDFQFKDAGDLKPGDWVEYPNIYYNKTLTPDSILEKWLPYEDIGRIDFKLDNPLMDEEFWWFMGIWLAEGWLEKYGESYKIVTCHHIKETEYIEKIMNLTNRLFGRKCTVTIKPENNVTKIEFNSKQLSAFIFDTFGKYAKHKKISEWVKYLPNQCKINLIKGYYNGDGCLVNVLKNNKDYGKLSFISVSLDLIEGVQDMLFSLGVMSTSQKLRKTEKEYNIKGRKGISGICYELNVPNHDTITLLDLFNDECIYTRENRRIISNIFFSTDLTKIYHKITKVDIEHYVGNVYNFETDTHTFLATHIATHNCDVSRGDSEDATGYTIIDFDTWEQVVEYHGKIPPDIAALLVNKYSIMYNALTTFDITGGMGVATTAKLKDLKFPTKLLHYDKIEDVDQLFGMEDTIIPGINFASYNRRTLIVQALEEALRTGFRIRSERLCAELKKFIYKNGRADHMKNSHDDLIMALGMCLYVANTSFKKLAAAESATKAMLESWKVHNTPKSANPAMSMLRDIISSPHPNKNYDNQKRELGGRQNLDATKEFSWLFGDLKKYK